MYGRINGGRLASMQTYLVLQRLPVISRLLLMSTFVVAGLMIALSR
jgi:hypothetical protein